MSGRITALIGTLALSLVAATSPVTAASSTRVMALHSTRMAAGAVASATITRIGKGDFQVQVNAMHLPAPSSLHAAPRRTVYLVWAIDSNHKNSMMGVLVLKPSGATGTYRAAGTVMLQDITEISVTADLSARQHMPTMPMVSVLMSGHGTM